MEHDSLDGLKVETRIVAAGRPERGEDAMINVPISLNSTYVAPGQTGYGRYGNETWSALETGISAMEGGQTLVFASGMAALAAVFNLLPKGSVVTASINGYTGTKMLLQELVDAERIELRLVDVSDTPAVLAALKGTNLFWLETPTNPAMEVADLPLLIKEAKRLGAGVGVDNTFATALNQTPLALGADISMNSVSKFISGHSDIILGSLSISDPALFTRLSTARKLQGAIPGAFECWLALRGLRTLSVRLQRSQENAMELATRFLTHPKISRVRYPGLPSDPHHAVAKTFMKGFGAIVCIEVEGGEEAAELAVQSSRLVTFATSLGGVETLWERRHRWSAESPDVPKNLIRISVGIEDIEDIWSDINQALNAIG